MRGIKYRIRLGKAGQTNFGHLFCNFGQIGNFGHFCGSSIALRRGNVRFGCPKMLNGVVFTIFIPFSFSAISLYETHRRRCEMGVFSQPFCQATTQAGTTVLYVVLPYIRTCTCTRGCLTACGVCACGTCDAREREFGTITINVVVNESPSQTRR